MSNSGGIEVEQKFRLNDVGALEKRLMESGASFVSNQEEVDTYLRHPSRDFSQTDEALRIRQIGDWSVITYKGPRKKGPVKVRKEIEIPIVQKTLPMWLDVWSSLGFEEVAQVRKNRRAFKLEYKQRRFTITLDHVKDVGDFAEVELVVFDQAQADLAAEAIQDVAALLELHDLERRSYLSLVRGTIEPPVAEVH
jgi:adenylate cyclase class 2